MRFKEFHTEWKKLQIGNLIKERKEYTSDFEKYPLYSFTLESGITPKSERYERSFLVKAPLLQMGGNCALIYYA